MGAREKRLDETNSVIRMQNDLKINRTPNEAFLLKFAKSSQIKHFRQNEC